MATVSTRLDATAALTHSVSLACSTCGASAPLSLHQRCPCGGLLDPVYALAQVVLHPSTNPLVRYRDLLPLPPGAAALDLGVHQSPCLLATTLGPRIGLQQLWLKNETVHPTRTTKDRMAAIVLSVLEALGVPAFVASSTGNSSTAFARGVQQQPALEAHLFCGRDWVARHQYCDHPRVQLHVVDGTFVDAGATAQRFAQQHGLLWEGGFFNWARREGLKTAYLEAFDQMTDAPQVIIQAVSSAMGLYGAYRGLREYQQLGRLRTTPRLVAAQQATCAPIVAAWQAGSPTLQPQHIVAQPSGLAEAILRGDPSGAYPHIYRILRATQGTAVAVSAPAQRIARQLLYETEGIDACYASATALAAAIQLRQAGAIREHEPVLVMLTGADRPPQEGAR